MSANLVLVLNCGSSSIKFAVIDHVTAYEKITGLVQCIGMENSSIQWKINGEKTSQDLQNVDYKTAILKIVDVLGTIDDLVDNLIAVGHRVVHGGENFTKSVVINDEVLTQIRACCELAPLHNPANITGIESASAAFSHLPQVAVFDTAFHQSMPAHAYIYAIPYEFYEKYGVRRYGFHGTSHKYVTQEAAKILGLDYNKSALISAHLGNGCSIAAALNGKSVDTSMGLTPLEGLVMGTRSGDLDPSIHGFLADKLNCDIKEITNILNKKSGLLGVSCATSDMRGIEDGIARGDKQALLAEDVFAYRLAKYILSYTAPLGRLDALIFTGGIGENGAQVREKVLGWLGILGFKLDPQHNKVHGKNNNGIISTKDSPITMVVPTNEELMIAKDAATLALA